MGIATKAEVTLNEIRFPLNTAFSWDVPPAPIEEEIEVISDSVKRKVRIQDQYAEGTIEFRGVLRDGSNDPLDIMDALLRSHYSYYDTSTSTVVHSSTKYDWDYEVSGNLGVPKKPFELRQVEATADVGFDEVYYKISYSFKAGGDLLRLFRFKAREALNGDFTQVYVEIFDDNSGEPGSKLSGSNTVHITGLNPADGSDYTDADWLTIDFDTNDLLGTATLTKGERYHIVLEFDSEESGFLCYSGNNRYQYGDMYRYDTSWNEVSGACPTFILQFYNTLGGHNIRIRTKDGSNYQEYFCEACDVMMSSPDVGPNRSIIFRMKFRTNKVTLTKSYS